LSFVAVAVAVSGSVAIITSFSAAPVRQAVRW